jgi:hypothetical protein
MQKEGSLLVMERLVEGWRFAYGSFLVFDLVYMAVLMSIMVV